MAITNGGTVVHNERHSVEEHITALRRYARILTGNSTDSDDLVQECLTKALSKVTRWKEIRNIRSFLFTIMHNLHIDRIRREAKSRSNVSFESIGENQFSCAPRQAVMLELREIHDALQKLPREQRETLLLVSLDGMTYREVSDIMSVPVGTVMSRLSRGREALRRHVNGGHRRVGTTNDETPSSQEHERPYDRVSAG